MMIAKPSNLTSHLSLLCLVASNYANSERLTLICKILALLAPPAPINSPNDIFSPFSMAFDLRDTVVCTVLQCHIKLSNLAVRVASMHPLVLGCFFVCISGLFYYQYKLYNKRCKFQRDNQCAPALKLPQIETVIGFFTMLENLKSWKARMLLRLTEACFYIAGFTYSATIGGNCTIFTIEPENIKAVFADCFDDFDVGWLRLRAFAPTIGEVLITTDGARWHHQRAMMRPAFNRRQILDYDFFKSGIDVLIRRLPKDGSAVDMAPLFHTHALTLASRLLFGESMASLNPNFNHSSQQFINAVRETNRGTELRLRLGRLLLLMPRDHQYEKAKGLLHGYADVFVEKTLNHRRSWELGEKESNGGFGDRHIFLHELAKESEDPIYLRNHLLGMLIVGSETTASLLTGCPSLLSKRPDLWAGMRSEVLNMGDQQSIYERIKALHFLTYLINEVLRLYPILPLYSRVANKNTFIPSGGGPDGKSKVFVPKGTHVQINTFALHRRQDLYGPDAKEFKPKRWAYLKPTSWAYLPFSARPRVCIGQQYALMEVSYTLVRLLQEFSSIESRDPEAWSEQLGIAYTNANGARVSLTPTPGT